MRKGVTDASSRTAAKNSGNSKYAFKHPRFRIKWHIFRGSGSVYVLFQAFQDHAEWFPLWLKICHLIRKRGCLNAYLLFPLFFAAVLLLAQICKKRRPNYSRCKHNCLVHGENTPWHWAHRDYKLNLLTGRQTIMIFPAKCRLLKWLICFLYCWVQ